MKSKLVTVARTGLFICALITAAFAFSPPRLGAHIFPWDKADHFAAFFTLMAATLVSFPRTRMIWLAIWVSAAGGLIELVQALPFVRRDCDVWDWVAENAAIASVIGVVIAAKLRRYLAKHVAGRHMINAKEVGGDCS